MLVKSLGDTAKKITELRYASKELGMSEEALRAWGSAAEKAGIAPEAMNSALKNFKRNTEDFSLRIGNVREELVKFGAGPVLAAMNAATDQSDKLKVAFDFKEVLDKADPSGVKARRFFEMIGLGADTARLSYKEFIDEKAKQPILTEADKAAAKAYADGLVDLGTKWDILKTKMGVKLFPFLADELNKAAADFEKFVTDVTTLWGNLQKMQEGGAEGKKAAAEVLGTQPFGPSMDFLNQTPAELAAKAGNAWGSLHGQPGLGFTETPNQSLASKWWGDLWGTNSPGPGRAVGGPVSRGIRYTVGENGPEQFTPSTSGMIHPAGGGGGDEANQSRIIKVGVFDALVEFKSYIEAGALGQGGGGGAGIIKASLGGSSGGYSGGSGGGGSGGDGSGTGGSGGGSPSGQSASRPDGTSAPNGAPDGANAPTGDGSAGPNRVTANDQNNKIASVKASIKSQLLAEGATDQQAEVGANVLTGQAMAESSLKSQYHDAGRTAAGKARGHVPSIYGADLARGKAMTAWLAKNNLPDTPENQGKWMAHEAWTKYPKTRAAIQTGNQDHAADVATKNYEAPQDQGPGQLRRRREFANQAARAQTTDSGPQAGPGQPQAPQPNGQSNSTPVPGAGGVSHKGSGTGLPPDLLRSMGYAGTVAGVSTNIAHGNEPGHARHRPGADAGDIDLFDEKGRKLDSRIPADREKMAKYIEAAAASGSTGIGMGSGSDYMGPSRMHVGKGNPAVWGAKGAGRNAPQWVRDAYARGRANQVSPAQQQAAIDAQKKTNTARIDQQVAPASPSGQVNVTVNSNGTKADADVKKDGDLFQKPQVKQHRQMQKTEDAGEPISI
jgi:hypothetical protein